MNRNKIKEALEQAEAGIHDWTLGSERKPDEEYVYMRASIGYKNAVLKEIREALALLSAPADPGEEPPYKLVKLMPVRSLLYRIERPDGTQLGPYRYDHAKLIQEELNAAWKAGRSSLPQVTLDIEGEARKWWGSEHDKPEFCEYERLAAFAKYMLSVSAHQVQGEGGDAVQSDGPGDPPVAVAPSLRDQGATPPIADDRDPACVAQWPECEEGTYDPHCCRFPKSCSCRPYSPPTQAPQP